MKKVTTLFLLLVIATTYVAAKDPVVIEVVTKHKNITDALQATKTILLGEKFITQEVQEKNFTATRTTGSKADYFVADVTATEANGSVKIAVTFVKVGTGLLNLKKVADRVKAKLEIRMIDLANWKFKGTQVAKLSINQGPTIINMADYPGIEQLA